jgi:hypothetical protein
MKQEEELFGLSEQDLLLDEARRVAFAAGFKSAVNAAGLLEERGVVASTRVSLLKVFELQEIDSWQGMRPGTYEAARRQKNPVSFREWLTTQSFMTEWRPR